MIAVNRTRVYGPRATMLSMSRRAVSGVVAVAAVAVPSTAIAASKAGHEPRWGCKTISVTESAPDYTSAYDKSGTVVVTTKQRCRGKITITKTVKIVTRDIPGTGVAPAHR